MRIFFTTFRYTFWVMFLSLSLKGQTIDESFKPSIFKYNKNEIPVTIGLSGGIGFASNVFGAGVNLNMDIYHIFLGYSIVRSPITGWHSSSEFVDYAYFLGYRYRKNKSTWSIGSGFGKTYIFDCNGLPSSNCEDGESDTFKTIPAIIEYCYFPIPYGGMFGSLNMVFGGPSFQFALLTGIKIGIARKHKDSSR